MMNVWELYLGIAILVAIGPVSLLVLEWGNRRGYRWADRGDVV